jgi:hypothetical protein
LRVGCKRVKRLLHGRNVPGFVVDKRNHNSIVREAGKVKMR